MPQETPKFQCRAAEASTPVAPQASPAIRQHNCPSPSFSEEAECCLITLKDTLLQMGHEPNGKLVALVDRALRAR